MTRVWPWGCGVGCWMRMWRPCDAVFMFADSDRHEVDGEPQCIGLQGITLGGDPHEHGCQSQ